MEGVVWGLLGTVSGALASLLTSALTFRNQTWINNQSNEQERDTRNRDFQRITPIELQDTIHDLTRLITQGHIDDIRAYHLEVERGRNLLSDELSEGQRLARRKLVFLIERVADDQPRKSLEKLNQLLPTYSSIPSMRDADIQIQTSSRNALRSMEHMGEALRSQH